MKRTLLPSAKATLLAAALLLLLAPSVLPAQNSPTDRLIVVDNSDRRSPVRFSGIRCGGQDVKSGVPFSDPAPDWLDDCTVQITNYVDKVLTTVHLLVFAPETGTGKPGSPQAAQAVAVGKLPYWQAKDLPPGTPTGDGLPIALHSGESTTLSCSRFAAALERLAAQMDKSSAGISQVKIVMQASDFADGTQSQRGLDNFYKPNQAAGRGYIRISRDEFYKGIQPPQ